MALAVGFEARATEVSRAAALRQEAGAGV